MNRATRSAYIRDADARQDGAFQVEVPLPAIPTPIVITDLPTRDAERWIEEHQVQIAAGSARQLAPRAC